MRLDAALSGLRALDEQAARPTALARLDPRAKVLATAAFLITLASLDRYAVAALLPLALFPLSLAWLGQLAWRPILRQILLVCPFALMVGLFNPLYDTEVMLHIGPYGVSAGWVSLASILLRCALSVAAALVLIAGTGMHPLCVGLARLGVPAVLTTQLLLLHRYMVVLGAEARRMSLARALRARAGAGLPLRVYASLLGHLLLRAVQRAERIYQALRARGFDGQLRSVRTLRWRAADSALLLGSCSSLVLLRWIDWSCVWELLPALLGLT